jgi:signal transduction histidine kinase
MRDVARGVMTEMEAMLDELRSVPLENTSLFEALKKQCEALGFRTGADVHFGVGDPLPPSELLPPGAHDAIFRIAHEALANIGRHARATHVNVTLTRVAESRLGFGDALELRIEDDGAGFDLGQDEHQGMGITNMRARAEEIGAVFALEACRGIGVTIRVVVPCDRPLSSYQNPASYGYWLGWLAMPTLLRMRSVIVISACPTSSA